MEHVELVVLFLLVAVSVLTALARLLGVPYPIMLVVGGSLVGFAPGVPEIELEPDLVLLIFLPPLLFNAAYFSSLRDLRRGARPITLNAVGLVLVTTALVAVAAHAAIEGLPWAAAFALGAIVSPTDPLAATAIMRRLGAPRRLVSVVEGESLVNDGTALVLYRTAVLAVGGTFGLLGATWDFVVNAAGGIAIGVAVGLVLVKLFRKLVADDTVGVVLSLAAGYLGYLPAEEIGVSGVLAAVAVGLDRRPPLVGAVDACLPPARLRVLGGAGVPPQRGAVHPGRAAAAVDPRGAGALRRRAHRPRAAGQRGGHRRAAAVGHLHAVRDPRARPPRVAARPPHDAGASGCWARGPGCAARSRWPPRWRCRWTSPSAG